jgi:hypothetical protein
MSIYVAVYDNYGEIQWWQDPELVCGDLLIQFAPDNVHVVMDAGAMKDRISAFNYESLISEISKRLISLGIDLIHSCGGLDRKVEYSSICWPDSKKVCASYVLRGYLKGPLPSNLSRLFCFGRIVDWPSGVCKRYGG